MKLWSSAALEGVIGSGPSRNLLIVSKDYICLINNCVGTVWANGETSQPLEELFLRTAPPLLFMAGVYVISALAVKQVFSNRGPWTCSISITWELVRDADSWTLSQTSWIRSSGGMGSAVCVTISPGNSESAQDFFLILKIF